MSQQPSTRRSISRLAAAASAVPEDDFRGITKDLARLRHDPRHSGGGWRRMSLNIKAKAKQ